MHGDEEVDPDLLPGEIEEEFYNYGGDEDDDPPEVSEEELERLDKEAKEKEINRMLQIPAMVETNRQEVEDTDGYVISTKEVMCWKHRLEQIGWFRRARLVARQFRSSVDIEQTFAPTSLMVIPKLLVHMLVNVHRHFVAMTLDVKDAFLMSPQPHAENAFVQVNDRIFKLIRCLPGQRTAAAQWFNLFSTTCIEYGMEQDSMQPTLMFIANLLYLTVHVDDVFIVGREDKVREFVIYLKDEKRWNVEEKGPFALGSKFYYLKRQFELTSTCCDIRCDRKQYDSFEKDVDLYTKFYRKTPLHSNYGKRDDSEPLQGEEVTKFRSIVGRLMYMAGERPDAQFGIQCLARQMAKPTRQSMENAWHICSYMFGTGGYGVRIDLRAKGQSVLDMREAEEVEDQEEHLLEVVTDADYAGNKNDRKSTTSFQIFLDGNLMESKVRAQKAISLSSGESEFVAMVGGCSDGLLIRHLWNKITGGNCVMKVRSDSSAARAMAQRQGIGRVRHLDAALLWIQQKEKEKILSVAPIPTEINSADLGTKNLSRKRFVGLLYMLKMVDAIGTRVGENEYKEIEEGYKMKQSMKKIGKSKDVRICLLMLLSTLDKAAGSTTEEKSYESGLDWMWFTMCLCACIGALSICQWLRVYMTEFMHGTSNSFLKYVRELFTVKVKVTFEKEAQASIGPEQLGLEKCEKEMNRMQNECFLKDTYIEELEEQVRELKERILEFGQELQLQSRSSTKECLQNMNSFRMTKVGSKIHFSPRCLHWQGGMEVKFCVWCLSGGSMLESHGTS